MGMRPARLIVPIFESNDPRDIAFSTDAIRAGVTGLMLINCVWLKYHPDTPPLYESGVIYVPEKRRVINIAGIGEKVLEYGEDWQSIPAALKKKKADCEDLAAWRAAELRMKGIKARPWIKVRKLPSGAWRAHAVVKWPNGRIEDPSAKLGMYAYS
jgi:Transglutaminase-like superfamily